MTIPEWKNKLSFLQPVGSTYEVCGTSVTFYAMSTRMLFKLNTLSRPLAQAISVLFANTESDSGRSQKDYRIPGEEGAPDEIASETVIQSVDTDILRVRMDAKEKAVDRLISAFSDDNNKRLLAGLVFDSCRDIFPRKPADSELDDFMEQLELTMLVQFLTGLAKANTKVFGPLGERVSEAFESRLGALDKKENDQEGNDPLTSRGPTPSPTPQESQPSLTPTPGPIPPPMIPTPVPGS